MTKFFSKKELKEMINNIAKEMIKNTMDKNNKHLMVQNKSI